MLPLDVDTKPNCAPVPARTTVTLGLVMNVAVTLVGPVMVSVHVDSVAR